MIGWVDATAGVSGDMLLGALVDAGVPAGVLAAAVDPLRLGVRFGVEEVRRGGLRASRVVVECPDEPQPRRTLPDVAALLAPLDADVRARALAVFGRLADAEAAVHGVARDEVHFHEVGALDAIADIVGVVAGVAALGLDALHASQVGLGSGRVGAEHGSLPVPAPAVLELTRGLPVVQGPAAFESATPTGVALLAELVTDWTGLPAMTTGRIGVGAGGRDATGHPNVLRLALGEPTATSPGDVTFQVAANVDDMDPRLWPEALAAVLDAGALDVWLTPIHMKKGRPAVTVAALVAQGSLDAVQRALLTETTTIGVRVAAVDRVTLARTTSEVQVEGHPVRVKHASLDGVEVNRSVEWEDVLAAARALGRPAKDVLADATAASRQDRVR